MKTSTRFLFTALVLLLLILGSALNSVQANIEVIPPEEARHHAALSLIRYVAFGNPLLEEWHIATLGDEVLLWDPGKGELEPLPLMYDFQVNVNGEPAGRMTVPATQLLGSTTLSIVLDNRTFDVEQSLEQAVENWLQTHPEMVIYSVIPVVYQYPKIAAMIDFENPNTGVQHRVYIELPSEEIIKHEILNPPPPPYEQQIGPGLGPHGRIEDPASKALFNGSTGDNGMAPGKSDVVSIYGMIPLDAYPELFETYAAEKEVVEMTAFALADEYQIDMDLNDPIAYWQWPSIKDYMGQLGWYQEDTTILPTHKCKLIKQEVGDWCARAVAQMIMYYHFNMLFHTQTEIDFYMNAYGWDKKWKYAMTRYYTKWLNLTDAGFDPNITTATMNDDAAQQTGFDNLRDEIDNGYPLCDGVPVHARMVMAYTVYGHNQIQSKYDIGIYDPAMYSGGVSWETGWKDSSFGLAQVAPRYFLFMARFAP